MGPWEFLIAVCSGYLGLVVGFALADRWAEGRRRDRRVEEWTRMIRENQARKRDEHEWATKTWREKKED